MNDAVQSHAAANQGANSCELCSGQLGYGTQSTNAGRYMRCEICSSEFLAVANMSERESIGSASQARYYGHQSLYHGRPLVDRIGERAAMVRLRILARYLRRGSVLEVGPGAGHFLRSARRIGYKVEGLEQSPDLVGLLKHVSPSLTVHTGTLESTTLGHRRFDALAEFHVIEHVPDPNYHLERARRLVRPGGILLLATPNSRGWQHRLLGTHSPSYSSAHVTLFSAKGIRLGLERAGWHVIEEFTTEPPESILRGITAVIRRFTGSAPGQFVEAAPQRLSAIAITVAAAATWPLRRGIAALGGGNELVMVARADDRP